MSQEDLQLIRNQLDYLTSELIKLRGENKLLEEENKSLKHTVLELRTKTEKIEERLDQLASVNETLLKQVSVTTPTKQVEEPKEEPKEEPVKTESSDSIPSQSLFFNNEVYSSLLYTWIKEKQHNDISLDLIFSSSKHALTKSVFNDCCMNQGSILICIESEDHSLFGGYLQKGYTEATGYVKDKDCFLFTLKNSHSIPPTKFDTITGKTAFYNFGKKYLFSFGTNEILISENCNGNKLSKLQFLQSFKNDYQDRALIFSSSEYFSVSTLEVYKVNMKCY